MIRELSMSETMQLRHKNYFDHFMFELLGKTRPRWILLGLRCTVLNEAYNLWLWRMRVTFGASGASKGFGFASTETRNQTFFGHPVCGFRYMFCIYVCVCEYICIPLHYQERILGRECLRVTWGDSFQVKRKSYASPGGHPSSSEAV